MGGVYPLNEEIMNSTIANSSSIIDIPAGDDHSERGRDGEAR